MPVIAEDDLSDASARALVVPAFGGMYAHSPLGAVFALDLSGLKTGRHSDRSQRTARPLVMWRRWKDLGDAGELKSMRTRPEWLRRGVAAALLERIIVEARRRGMNGSASRLAAERHSEPALAFYRRRGFVDGGRLLAITKRATSTISAPHVDRDMTDNPGWRALSRLLSRLSHRLAPARRLAARLARRIRNFCSASSRRQHLATFRPVSESSADWPAGCGRLRAISLSLEPDRRRARRIHARERPQGVVRYAPPRWIWEGTAICGDRPATCRAPSCAAGTRTMRITLGNPRLGFVCTKQTPDGQDELEGYYEYDRDLRDDERLRFSRSEEAPPASIRQGACPACRKLAAGAARQGRAITSMEYVRSLIPRSHRPVRPR